MFQDAPKNVSPTECWTLSYWEEVNKGQLILSTDHWGMMHLRGTKESTKG